MTDESKKTAKTAKTDAVSLTNTKGAVFEEIRLEDILVQDRLIPVNEARADLLALSIAALGLMNPITVRRTPNGQRKLMLVAGAHRVRAFELLGRGSIAAHVVEADAKEARLLEVLENLARNELTVLDRAVSIFEYRRAWEARFGKITRGKPVRKENSPNWANIAQLGLGSQDHNYPASANLVEIGMDGRFGDVIAARMGISKRLIKYLMMIAKNLPADLKDQIRDTTIADNQRQLLTLASLPPEVRARAAEALRAKDNDFEAALAMLTTRPAPKSRSDKRFDTVIVNMYFLSKDDRRRGFQEMFRLYGDDAEWARQNPLPPYEEADGSDLQSEGDAS
ncbi:MAG: ParB N-terminal domain-containing protein [Rhizobiales bacterium]|nr:ParB N-terminal domain-containing protein [Hyphomicrobiales bacterium]